jgi:hypothetical protein
LTRIKLAALHARFDILTCVNTGPVNLSYQKFTRHCPAHGIVTPIRLFPAKTGEKDVQSIAIIMGRLRQQRRSAAFTAP